MELINFHSAICIIIFMMTIITTSSSHHQHFATAQTCNQSGASPIQLPAFSGSFGPCPPGYYCPGLPKNSAAVYICPPTEACLQKRLTGEEFCDLQGSADVAICFPGFYCPTYDQRLICPSGNFCPVGSTEPVSCSPLSYCPEGATREIFYGAILILFFILLLFGIGMYLAARFVGAVPESWSNSSSNTSPDAVVATDDNNNKLTVSNSLNPSASMNASANESMRIIGEAIKKRRDVQTEARKLPGSNSLKKKNGGIIKGKETLSINFTDLCVTVPVPAEEIEQAAKDEEKRQQAAKKQKEEEKLEMEEELKELEKDPSATHKTPLKKEKEKQDKSWHSYNDKGEKILLHPMSGTLSSGRVTLLLAPSGSGKSITMSRLLGRKDPSWITSGRVQTTTTFDEIIDDENQNDECSSNAKSGAAKTNKSKTLGSGASTAITSRPLSDNEFRDLTALVIQEDILHYELTVHQNLFFSSETRLPASWSHEDKDTFRKAILDGLQILPYADRRVGAPADQDESGAGGLSGGQRKRCSIAQELASAPIFLALDEPTTGLDSAIAIATCSLLKRLAVEAQIPILMCVHQPRIEIWEQVSDVILLSLGGRQCFAGPREDCLDYFREYVLKNIPDHGFDLDDGNPADILIDIISMYPDEVAEAWKEHADEFKKSIVSRKINRANNNNGNTNIDPSAITPAKDNTNTITTDNSPDAVIIEDHTEEEDRMMQEAEELRLPSTVTFQAAENNNSKESSKEKKKNTALQNNNNTATRQNQSDDDEDLIIKPNEANNKPGILLEAWYMFLRRFLKYGTEWKLFLNDILMAGLCSAIMAASVVGATWGAPLQGQYVLLSAKFQNELPFMYGMLAAIGAAAAVGPTSIRVWGLEKKQLLREFAAGNRVTSVYIGYSVAETLRIFVLSFIYAVIAYMMWRPVMQFGDFFGAIFCIFICQDAAGAWVGIIVDIVSARLIALITTVFLSLLNGFPDVPIIFYGFFTYWTTILFAAAELEPSKDVFDFVSLTGGDAFGNYIGDPISWRGVAAVIILLWYLFFKIGAFVHLVYLAKKN